MELKYKLSKQNIELLSEAENSDIKYCIPFDIGDDGQWIKDSFVVATSTNLVVLKAGKRESEYNFANISELKSEVLIGSGMLVAVMEDGKEELVVRFSAKHLSRFAYISRGCMLLIKKSKGILDTAELVKSEEYETICPKCGRALPGTKECPHCSKKKSGTMHEVFNMVAPHKSQMAGIIVLMILASVVTLLSPEIQKILVDRVLKEDPSNHKLAIICLIGMAIASLTIAVINVLKSYACAKLGGEVARDLRAKQYAKLQTLSLSYINDRKPGMLMSRIVQDTERIREFMSDTFCNLFTVAVIFVFMAVYMLILNWKLAILAFVFAPTAAIISRLFRRNIHRRFHLQWVKDDKVRSNLQDVISGMAVVKSYGKEEYESQRFSEAAEDFYKISKRNEIMWAVLFPCVNFLVSVGIYLITFVGGKQILDGTMTTGELIQFVSYTSMLYQYVNWLSMLPRQLMNLVTSLERISDIMNQDPKIVDTPNSVDLDIKGDIEFRDASFGYKTYQPVLEHINLQVKAGEMIGLVGASGTGKSTMINLIMHLYDVDDGAILVDGVDIKDIKLEKFHSQIGVVLQETFLFSGTILNNIRFARPDATLEEIITAAKMANAHDFIVKTPDGYNTYVGEHGYNLSGGERQRVAIARAILNNPRILILDEATASLDTESEYLIQKALERLTDGKTTFAIAHRLSTLQNADRLVVIDGHHIAEVGTHNELMEKKGIYYGLVQAQLEMQKTKGEI